MRTETKVYELVVSGDFGDDLVIPVSGGPSATDRRHNAEQLAATIAQRGCWHESILYPPHRINYIAVREVQQVSAPASAIATEEALIGALDGGRRGD